MTDPEPSMDEVLRLRAECDEMWDAFMRGDIGGVPVEDWFETLSAKQVRIAEIGVALWEQDLINRHLATEVKKALIEDDVRRFTDGEA